MEGSVASRVLWLLLSLVPGFPRAPSSALLTPAPPDPWAAARERMVAEQVAARGVSDAGVLAAMRAVPRHLFVPAGEIDHAYEDRPLPIGYGQTISQPYIVALMTALARPQPGHRVLEVGTGSGYQAAILSRVTGRVFSVEIVEARAHESADRLARLGYDNVTVRAGDGYLGWPEQSPFDAILVTAAPDHVPPALVAQLKPGGRLVIPVGAVYDVQELQLIEKDQAGRVRTHYVTSVRFVPLTRKKQ